MKKLSLLILTLVSACLLIGKTTVTPLSETSFIIHWECSDYQLVPQDDYLWLQAKDMDYNSESGAPLIPYAELKAAIPMNGAVTVSAARQSLQTVTLEKRLLPVPQIVKTETTDINEYTINENLYRPLSRDIISILPAQRFRSLSFVPIRINPFIYDGKKQLQILKSIEFTVSITGDTRYTNQTQLDELTELMTSQLLNPAQARQWHSTTRRIVKYADFSLSDTWVRIDTDKDGMYKITPAQLSMLPIADIDPSTIRIFTTGGEVQSGSVSYEGQSLREVPIEIIGEADGNFDTNDYILFYGRDRDGFEMNQNTGYSNYLNPYSQEVAYWLTWGGSFTGSPLRISPSIVYTDWQQSVTTTQATIRLEEDNIQRNSIGYDWFMNSLSGNSYAEYTFTVNAEDLDTTQQQTISAKLQQEYLRNGSGTNHRLRVSVNGNYLQNYLNEPQEWTWIGQSPITISHSGSYHNNGNNNLRLHVYRGGTDNLLLDYLQVVYQKQLIKRNKQFPVIMPNLYTGQSIRYTFQGNATGVKVYKIKVNTTDYEVKSETITPVVNGFSYISAGETGTNYLVTHDSDFYSPQQIELVTPTDLISVTEPLDNIIITPPDYQAHAVQLKNLYQLKWNKRSKIVLLQDIFNQFSGGMPDPNAIRMYLSYAMQNYPAPAITSATLLGSGTIDWRNNSGQAAAKNKMICFQKGTTTADDYFAMFNTVQYPELAIGRYPAKNTNEMDNMLSNLISYLDDPQPGLWRNTLLFMADDEYNGDSSGEFYHSVQLQETSEGINRGVLVDKIMTIDYEFDEFQNKPRARDDMFKAINDGKLMFYYIGHGSYDKLGAEDYFNGAVDMNRFNNTGKLNLFLAASCDIAQFDHYAFDCLSEKTVLLNNRGSIASLSATRECLAYNNVPLMQHFYNYSVNLRNPLGYSLVMAKLNYTENNTNDEKFVILGDPILPVIPPVRDSSLVITTANGDNLLNSRERVTVTGAFPAMGIDTPANLQIFNCDQVKNMASTNTYTLRGGNLYRGDVTVSASAYTGEFIVPDDVTVGNTAVVMAYVFDPATKKDYVNYQSSVSLSDVAAPADNPSPPSIELYLNDTDFTDGGDTDSSPLLIARLSDENGINTTNLPGHSILMILDYNTTPVNVTSLFSYDRDSHTQGEIRYQMSGLTQKAHTIQLIAFDNFNLPSVATLQFNVTKSSSISISDFLPYPNPMKKDGYFTFVLSSAAEVKITLHTIRGKKIKTIRHNAQQGYNQVYWDGKDEDGDYLGNNTYFIKMTAKALIGNGKAEKTEKLVIYH